MSTVDPGSTGRRAHRLIPFWEVRGPRGLSQVLQNLDPTGKCSPNIKCFRASLRAASAVVTVVDAQILYHPMNHLFPTSRSSF